MKEHSDNKVPLVRMSQDDPLNPSSTKNYQVDSENNNQGESNMIKEKFIKKPITFSRVSQSGQVEIKIGYLYSYTLNPIPTTLYTELDNVAP